MKSAPLLLGHFLHFGEDAIQPFLRFSKPNVLTSPRVILTGRGLTTEARNPVDLSMRRRAFSMSAALLIRPEAAPLHVDEHGVYRISGTRVTLESILVSFLEGAPAEEIAEQFPSVPLADIYATIAFYLKHRPEVDSYLRDVEQQEEAVLGEVRSRFPLTELRQRLLQRRSSPER